MKPESISTDRLSTYRTHHTFLHYAKVTSPEDFIDLCHWSKENNVPIYVLGNGSNTLFARRNIQTLICKNALPSTMRDLGDHRYEVSSSMQVHAVLQHCLAHSLDCFYHLASAPATIGGALAMNAGGVGSNTIYDFVESITYCSAEQGLVTQQKSEIPLAFRKTPFTGLHQQLIVSAVFHFPVTNIQGNPIEERIAWSRIYQDHTAPSCGSVFKKKNKYILLVLCGVRYGGARYSSKLSNWIGNRSKESRPIIHLITLATFLHKLLFQRIELEQVIVR